MANNKLVTVDVLQYNNEKIKEQLNKKINIEQGVDNKGKLLGVDDTGKVVPVDKPDSVKISDETGNQIEQKADGIYVKDMSAKISVEENNALVLKNDGLYVATVDEVKVSAEEGNAITSKDDGLYVPSVSETKISAEEGNAIVSKDDGIYVPTTAETKVSSETDNKIETKDDGIYVAPTDLSDYSKTEDVEKLIEDELYTSTTTPAHYEIADDTTPNALEVVADGTTLADGQIEQSSVTDLVVEIGDYVVWVDEATTTDEIYARKNDTYNKPEVDKKIAEAIAGGEIDLSGYVKHEEIDVVTEEEVIALLGLSEEELEGITQLISDTEVRIDKTYSSSKIYSELQNLLTESKTYTLEEISKKTGASYKIATVTADMTGTEYIYLLANGDTYDMYIVETEGSEPVKIGTTDIDLSDYYTIEKINNLYALKTTVGDLSTLSTTNKKSIVDAINEFYSIVPKTYATKTEVGDISTMKTNDKTSIVNAINELFIADYNATKTYATKTNVGDLTALKTTDKTSIVNAINENFSAIYDANKKHATKTEVGELTMLKATDKSSIVNAINENYNTAYNTNKAVDNIINGTTTVPKADTVDGWHIYSGLAEIGLSGSVTMTDVIAAMPNKSELRFTNNTDNPNCVSDVPDKYGFLTIKKNLYVEATWIAVNRKTTVPMYFGSWHSDNGWTGWSSSETSHLSNHNYLDNSDFKINQRGLTTYSSATDAIFCMDRWLINPNMTIAYSDTGSVLVTQSADQKQHFRQYLSDPKRFAGKTVTLSIGTTAIEGDIRLAIYDSPSTMTEGTWKYVDKNVFTVNIENGIRAVSIIPTTLGSTVEVQWVKLEIGSAATIYSPPDYAEELLKIQTMTDDGYTRLITNDTMPIIINSQMISNPNLLDNPDFSINQRGLTEYEVASKTYTVDRWKTPNVPSLIIPGDKQITIQRHSAATSKFSGLGQVVEKLVKGVYTFSIDIVSADATVPTITMRAADWSDIANNVAGTYYGIKSIANSTDIAGRYSLTFELPEDKENVYFYIYASDLTAEDAKFTIANAKLEAGKVATPFVAPHPAEELIKCQRYYQTLGNELNSKCAIVAIAQSPSWAPLGHVFPVEMKRQPTITLTYLAKWNKSGETLDLNTTATLHNISSKGIANLWSESNLLETGNAYYIKYTASAEL